MFVLCLDMSLDVLLVFRSILKQAPVCLCKPFLNLLDQPVLSNDVKASWSREQLICLKLRTDKLQGRLSTHCAKPRL